MVDSVDADEIAHNAAYQCGNEAAQGSL